MPCRCPLHRGGNIQAMAYSDARMHHVWIEGTLLY
jgi:hypothetical protein